MNANTLASGGVLTRLPPGMKLTGLGALGILLFVSQQESIVGTIAIAVTAVSLLFCRPAITIWLKSWQLLLGVAIIAIWTAYSDSPRSGLVVLMRLASLSLFATVVTATTTVGQFIDAIATVARPLELIGIANARDIGLAIGLAIRFLPEIRACYQAVADAHRARGLKMGPTSIVLPMIIGVLRNADEIADAIDARSIRRKIPPKN